MKKRWLLVIVSVFLCFWFVGVNDSRAGINDGLIAEYAFNGNAEDLSGHGHNASVHGAIAVPDRFGNPDSAYDFSNGTWIEIPNSDELDLPRQREMTISIWVKPASTAGSQSSCATGTDNDVMETIFASTNGKEGSCFSSSGLPVSNYDNVGFWFGFRNGKLQFYLRNNHKEWEDDMPFSHAATADTIPAPGVGVWSHIVIAISTVFDVSSQVPGENMGRVWIYVNGVKQLLTGEDTSAIAGQPTAVIYFPRDYSHDKPLFLGARYYDRTQCASPCVLDWINGQEGKGEFFAGAIDDLRIYNRILSSDEVVQLKNLGADAPDPACNYTEGPYTYYLPYFYCSSTTWTGYGISNLSTSQASPFSVTVYNGQGTIVKTVCPDPVPANGQASKAIFTGGETVGWMKINSHEKLAGLSFFGSTYMADIPFVDKLSSWLVVPHIAQNSDWDTYLMVCNPNDETVSLALSCYNRSGALVASGGFSLPRHASQVYPFSNFGVDNLTGKVEVSVSPSIMGVAAFALYTNQWVGGHYFAGINAVDLSAADFSNPF